MDVIETLRQQVSHDREMVRARDVMIDILAEAVGRLRLAGFDPGLVLGPCDALVTLRLDTSAWALRQVGLPVVPAVPDFLMPHVDLPQRAAAKREPVKSTACPSAPAVQARTFWTPENDARILEMRPRMTTKDIAAALGVSEKSVDMRFVRLRRKGVAVDAPMRPKRDIFTTPSVRMDGVVLRAWSEADDAALIKAYAAGDKDLSVLAGELGRSLSALSKRVTHLRRQGRITRHRGVVPSELKWPESRIQELRDLWPVMRAAEIASKLGLSVGAVTSKANRLELGSPFKGVVSPPADPLPSVAPGPAPEQKSEPVSVPKAEAVPAVPEPAPVPADRPAFSPKPGGNMVPAMSRPALSVRAPANVMPGMTLNEKAAVIAQHVEGLPKHAEFDAELDLELCEAVFSGGGLPLFSTDMGIDQREALARFNAIVAPLRDPGRKGLPIEAATLILPALRTRVANARGAAA